MKETGRNDPCPCGSGKKYKKCCLAADEAQSRYAAQAEAEAEAEAEEQRDEEDLFEVMDHLLEGPEILEALVRFSRKPRFRDTLMEAIQVFWPGEAAAPSAEAYADVCMSPEGFQLFTPFFLFDMPTPDGPTVAQVFLEEEAERYPKDEQAYLRAMSQTEYMLYEVADVRRDEGLLLRDVLTEEDIWVKERLGTHQLVRWDLLATRIRRGPEKEARLEPGVFLFPAHDRSDLAKAIRETWEDYQDHPPPDGMRIRFGCLTGPLFAAQWMVRTVFRPPPQLANTDGDPLLMVTQRYQVRDRETVLQALAAHPELEWDDADESYRWIREQKGDERLHLAHLAFEGDSLVAETNSKKRARALRNLLKRVAGAALKLEETTEKSMEELLEESGRLDGPQPDSADSTGIPPEAQRELMSRYLDKHMHEWIDTPLPALDGSTPREAALLPDMRGDVVNLLKDFENREARRCGGTDDAPYDMGWLWKELGLDPFRD